MFARVDPDGLLIGVVAHVSRKGMARKLAKRTGAQVLNIDAGQPRTQQEAFDACTANHLDVLRQLHALVTEETPWCIVLEDDALPIDSFRVHAAAALRHAPSPVIGFYMSRAGVGLNRGPIERAAKVGTAWAVSNSLISALAYAIDTEFLPEIIASYEKQSTNVEGRFNNWAYWRRETNGGGSRFHYTIPSLVDHAVGDSLIFPVPCSRIRRAWRLGAATSWDTPAVEYDPD